MFNKLLKITVIGFIWSRYGTMILSAIVLFAWFWVVGLVHEDYLSYLTLQGEGASAGWSFLLKWLAFLVGVICYWWFNSYARKKFDKKEKGSLAEPSNTQAAVEADLGSPNSKDPFDKIRRKEKLRSKADLVIDHKP